MKKVIFMLAFALMSGFSFSNNEALKGKEEVKENDDFGVCRFSYQLIATNSITGEQRTYTYTRSVEADSEAECNYYARASRSIQAMLLSEELN